MLYGRSLFFDSQTFLIFMWKASHDSKALLLIFPLNLFSFLLLRIFHFGSRHVFIYFNCCFLAAKDTPHIHRHAHPPHTHWGNFPISETKRKLFLFSQWKVDVAAAVFAFNWAIFAYKRAPKKNKRHPKMSNFGFNLSSQQLMQDPGFPPPAPAPAPLRLFLPFAFMTATMIGIHIEFRFQFKVFIVAGSDLLAQTCQLLFKRFMQGNCRLSLMDINFYGGAARFRAIRIL